MSVESHIVNTALPPAMDFNWLKNEALGFIQKYGGEEWTNYNPADPGVTILDQVCYAITELSYCTDFSIEDILTSENDGIVYENQFYTAEEILTTAPITVNDFKRSLIDKIDGIDNVIINTIPQKFSPVFGIYEVWLSIKEDGADQAQNICETVFLYLNQIRNVGTFFLMPKLLQAKNYQIYGQLSITKLNDLHQLVQRLDSAIDEQIFPTVEGKGYQQLVNEGYSTEEIFNGPKLKNGWIVEDALLPKTDQITTADLHSIFVNESLVDSINGLGLEEANEKHPDSKTLLVATAVCEPNEIIRFNLKDDIKNNRISITVNGKLMSSPDDLTSIEQELDKSASYQSSSNVIKSEISSAPAIPNGSYRDIESYYSIQNTLPEVFAVGKNAVTEGGSELNKALSKQLSGYLCLFDQLLANQFSQLSHVDQLLSFKNYLTADPADEKRYFQTKSTVAKSKQEYPSPYKKFAPTYYYQSLYDLPNVQPLLKGVEAFDSNEEPITDKALKNKAWKAYKENPYNAYIHGLMNYVETSSEGYQRRNKILDHLLARHGQSPYLINKIINGTFYTGDLIKDQIIIKSLYLQNFALLNYHEQSAYSFLSATKIEEALPTLDEKQLIDLLEEIEKDFILRADNVEEINQLNTDDFTNYSSIQLKFNLLLGIRNLYRQFILEQSNLENTTADNPVNVNSIEMQQANWFMSRKGGIFIETNLLSALANYEVIIWADTDDLKGYWRIGQYLSYNELLAFEEALDENDHIENAIQLNQIQIGTNKYDFQTLNASDVEQLEFHQLEESGFQIAFIANWGNNTATMGHSVLQNKLLMVVPDFIDEFSQNSFLDRLDVLMQDNLPLYVGYELYRANSDQLKDFISAYIKWHNSLLHVEDITQEERLAQNQASQQLTDELITQLTTLKEQETALNGTD